MTSPSTRITLLVICLGASVARADESQPAPASADPHVAVSGTLGIATPVGEAGIELEARLARWLSLSAGVGLGASGPQLATMVRLGMPATDSTTVQVGFGLSEGAYTWTELTFDEPAKKTWERAYWMNAELGLAYRFDDGRSNWSLRTFGGIGKVINDQDFSCNDDHCMTDHQGDGASQKYVGVSVGRAFSNL